MSWFGNKNNNVKNPRLPQEMIDAIFSKGDFETCLKSRLCSKVELDKLFIKEGWTKEKAILENKINIYDYIVNVKKEKHSVDDVKKAIYIENMKFFKHIYKSLTILKKIDYISLLLSSMIPKEKPEFFKIIIDEMDKTGQLDNRIILMLNNSAYSRKLKKINNILSDIAKKKEYNIGNSMLKDELLTKKQKEYAVMGGLYLGYLGYKKIKNLKKTPMKKKPKKKIHKKPKKKIHKKPKKKI